MSNFLNFAGNSGVTFKSFTASGGTTYTLDVSSSTNSLMVSIGGVLQKPSTDYTVSGTTLTTTDTIASGIVIDTYVIHSAGGTTPIIEDNSVTGAKIAMGSDAAGDILYYNGTDYVRLGKGTTGHYLSQGGSNAPAWAEVSAGGGMQSVQVFTSSGTWNRPSGITSVLVEVKGGGGGGAGGYTDSHSGSGGAEGGTAIEFLDVSSTSSATVTIGAGGTKGTGSNNGGGSWTAGGTGGTSSFASFCSATGGAGGQVNGDDLKKGALGGLGANGNLNLRGTASEAGVFVAGAWSVAGAGQGGSIGVKAAGTNAADGVNGGGGAGGAYGNGGQAGNGGVGGGGYVLVKEYK